MYTYFSFYFYAKRTHKKDMEVCIVHNQPTIHSRGTIKIFFPYNWKAILELSLTTAKQDNDGNLPQDAEVPVVRGGGEVPVKVSCLS